MQSSFHLTMISHSETLFQVVKRHDETDWFVGIGLRPGWARGSHVSDAKTHRQNQSQSLHPHARLLLRASPTMPAIMAAILPLTYQALSRQPGEKGKERGASTRRSPSPSMLMVTSPKRRPALRASASSTTKAISATPTKRSSKLSSMPTPSSPVAAYATTIPTPGARRSL